MNSSSYIRFIPQNCWWLKSLETSPTACLLMQAQGKHKNSKKAKVQTTSVPSLRR